jgi:two-component system sensor histidine kinase SenX3
MATAGQHPRSEGCGTDCSPARHLHATGPPSSGPRRTIPSRLTGSKKAHQREVGEANGGTSTTFLVAALDAIDAAVFVTDRAGRRVYRNAAARGLDIGRPDDLTTDSAVREVTATALAGEDRARTIALAGPPKRTLRVSGQPVASAGEVIGAVAVVNDLSEKVRLEAVRRDFVANVSHELKTPVGALGLVAEALEGETDPEVVSRLIRRIHAEAIRLHQMIDELIDLARIEDRGVAGLDPVPVSLLVGRAVERIREQAAERQIAIEVTEPPLGAYSAADISQIVTALHNLLQNAVKYSDRGSVVTVATTMANDTVEISVEDQGIGIPPRDLPRIFERFYRVDRARARDTGGTGLGLAIARHIVENHGGTVRVSSQEGKGSTFVLSLPAVEERRPASAPRT